MFYYFLWFMDLSIEEQNKQTMINILQGRTLLLSILKYHQKSTKTIFIKYEKGLWHIFRLLNQKPLKGKEQSFLQPNFILLNYKLICFVTNTDGCAIIFTVLQLAEPN